MRYTKEKSQREAGVALVISILVLFVLSALALALAVTAATENGVAVNHRWGEMAFYNADAGLEFAKNVLAEHLRRSGGRQFQDALPPARSPEQMNTLPSGDRQGRDYELSIQDSPNVKLYIGKVLVNPATSQRLEFDPRNPGQSLKGGDLDGDGSQDLQGTVTLWIRRPIVNGRDYAGNERVVVTAEGTAPNFESVASGRFSALRRLEMTLSIGGSSSKSLLQANALGNSDTIANAPTNYNSTDFPTRSN